MHNIISLLIISPSNSIGKLQGVGDLGVYRPIVFCMICTLILAYRGFVQYNNSMHTRVEVAEFTIDINFIYS